MTFTFLSQLVFCCFCILSYNYCQNLKYSNTFRDFRVFDFGYKTKSKTRKPRKFSRFLIKVYLDLYVFVSVNFFVIFASKLQLLSKFEVKRMSERSNVSIFGIGQIMFSQNLLFHAQVTKFFTSLKSHVSPLRHAAFSVSHEIWNL